MSIWASKRPFVVIIIPKTVRHNVQIVQAERILSNSCQAVPVMPTESCPRCGSQNVFPGDCFGADGSAHAFWPADYRKSWFVRVSQGVRITCGVGYRDRLASGLFNTCSDCGLLWSAISPDEFRAFIGRYGTDEARERVRRGRPQGGPAAESEEGSVDRPPPRGGGKLH